MINRGNNEEEKIDIRIRINTISPYEKNNFKSAKKSIFEEQKNAYFLIIFRSKLIKKEKSNNKFKATRWCNHSMT